MTVMSLEALSALEEIRQLKAKYAFLLDTKAWDKWRLLFTDDVQCDVNDVVTHGADRFVEWVVGRVGEAATIHHMHMPILELTSPTTAAGIWAMFDYLQFPESSPRPPFQGYGHYHEKYRLEPAGWKISYLQLTRLRIDDLRAVKPLVTSTFDPPDVTSAAANSLEPTGT